MTRKGKGFSLVAASALALLLAGQAAAQRGPSSPRAGSGPAQAADAQWLLAGPYPISAETCFDDGLDRDYLASSALALSGEASAAPLRIGAAGPGSWRESEAATAAGVDFLAAFGAVNYSVAYAYRDFYSASSRRVALKLGSDDGVKVWVNGELVLSHHVQRALLVDEDAVALTLAKGKNHVLVKVAQGTGEWGFNLRLVPLEEDERAAKSAVLTALAAQAEALVVPQGGAIRGFVMTRPGFCVDAEARVELLGPSGERLASCAVPVAGPFSLRAPAGFAGPARIRARGSGALSALDSPEAPLLVGDASALARGAADKARAAVKALSAGAGGTAAGAALAAADPAATLEFMASIVEGGLPPTFDGFASSMLALSMIEAMTGPSPGPRPGLARYAYRSSVDGSLQPYSLCLPSSYDPARRYGLVVALHGASGNDYEMAASLAAGVAPGDMLLVSPFGRGDMCYTSTGERDVLDVIDLVMARYAIDPDRVYLTGRSMGGYGTWRLAQLYSWRFAAIASFAGWTAGDCLENLVSTHVLAVHGDADDTVPIGSEEQAVRRLAAMGADARMEILPGVGHDALSAWTKKEGPARLFAWFRRYSRAKWPTETKLRTTLPRSGRGAWASILGLSRPFIIGAIDAKIVDSRHVTVETQNVQAMELDLRHPALAKDGRVLILADGYNLTANAGSAAARFELAENGRFAAAATSTETVKNGGSGYAALFDGAVKIVYGTQKRSRAAQNEASARALGDWEGDGAGTGTPDRAEFVGGPGRFEVLPDTALSPAMEASTSILLVGQCDENSVLARLAPRLPIRIKDGKFLLPPDAQAAKGKAGSGLLLVCPNPDAPGRLLGVFASPLRGKDGIEACRALVAPLRIYGNQSEPCGYCAPDVVIFDSSGQALWSGTFDWKWGKLTRLEMKSN